MQVLDPQGVVIDNASIVSANGYVYPTQLPGSVSEPVSGALVLLGVAAFAARRRRRVAVRAVGQDRDRPSLL